MSIKKDAFLALGNHLTSTLQIYDGTTHPQGILTSEMNLPGLRWFDKQMGQFSNPQLAVAIPLPCILMEYQPFTWITVGKREKRGNGVIRFYIYFENYADAFTGSVNQTMALQFFMFTEQVNIALEGFGMPGMEPLQMVADNEDTSEDMIITSTVDYGTILTDVSTHEERNFTMVDPTVIVERVPQISRPLRPGFKDGFIV